MSPASFLDGVLGLLLSGVLAVTGTPREAPPGDAARPAPAGPVAQPPVGSLGHDISWPNCPVGSGIPERRTLGLPLPPPSSRFVVIGLTNGPGFHANPCLGDQVSFARRRHLWTAAYAVVTYPTADQLRELGTAGPRDGGDLAGRLFNTGWAQARFNLGSMQAAGLTTPILWLDVEPVRPPAPWSTDVAANRVVLEGSMAAYRQAGLRLGVYSTPYLWRTVVGDVGYRLPEWRAAGATSMARALEVCAGEAIQGGVPVLGQWLDGVDRNVLCPGRPAREVLRSYFAPY